MSSPSLRTAVRDAIVQALKTLNDPSAAELRNPTISLTYDTVDECTAFPTYGVICTDETVERTTVGFVDIELDVLVVIYVKDEKDPRQVLDKAIEDVFRALLSSQTAKQTIPQLRLDSLATDEGTKIAKPYAQAVMRWKACGLRRPATW